jgi:hypothetical protein
MVRAAPALALLLAACAPAAVWERPGATDAERRRDETECASLATEERMVPRRRAVGRAGREEVLELEREYRFDTERYEACLVARGYRKAPR